MLVGAADHSIVICAIGFLTALRELLLSGPDATSPLNGTAPGLLTQCPQPLPAALSILCSLPSCMPGSAVCLTVCMHAAGTALVAQKVRKVVFQGGWYEPLHPNGHGTFNWDCGGAGQHWSPYARDGCAGAAQHVVCEIARQGSSHTVPSLSQRHSNLPTASSSMPPTSIARFSLCAACDPLPHTSPCVPPHPGDEHASDGTDDLFGHWRRDLPRRPADPRRGGRLRGGHRRQPVPPCRASNAGVAHRPFAPALTCPDESCIRAFFWEGAAPPISSTAGASATRGGRVGTTSWYSRQCAGPRPSTAQR